ncbi:hypothetical protein GC194_11230 [bacterium]|nr:hypothetical protein [bacterium]
MNKKIYWALASILAFVSLGAISGGYSLVNDPSGAGMGLSVTALDTRFLHDYKIPGLILTYYFGFSGMFIFSFAFKRFKTFTQGILLYGASLVVWILAQVAIIGFASWLQPLFLAIGLLMLWLGNKVRIQLKGINQW